MPRDVAVEALVDTKQAQEVRGDLVPRGAAYSLQEEGVEVIDLAEGRALTDVERPGQGFEMKKSPGQF